MRPPLRDLTPRERDIAALMDSGLTLKAISHRIGLSMSTVKKFAQSLKIKGYRRPTDDDGEKLMMRVPIADVVTAIVLKCANPRDVLLAICPLENVEEMGLYTWVKFVAPALTMEQINEARRRDNPLLPL